MSNHRIVAAVITAVGAAILAGCVATTTMVVAPMPTGASPLAGPTTAIPNIAASTSPRATTPSATPAPTATGIPSAKPTSAATALPEVPPAEAFGTIQGTVKDKNGAKLDGVTVTASVSGGAKFANGSDGMSVQTVNGGYQMTGVPFATPVVVRGAKTGFTGDVQSTVLLWAPGLVSTTTTMDLTLTAN